MIDFLRQFPVEEGHRLSAGDCHIRTEVIAAGADGDTAGYRPDNSVIVVGVLRYIIEAAAGSFRGTCRPPLEGDRLGTGHGSVRAEGGGAGAVGHAVGCRPEHRVIVPGALVHIRKRIAAGGLRRTVSAPEEGHHLSPGYRIARAEGGDAGAVGHAVGCRPEHRVAVVVALMDVGERVGHLFRALLEGDSDLYIGARHGEGVPVIARAGQFHLISFGVGDGESVKLVVRVRSDCEGHSGALVCRYEAAGYRTVCRVLYGDAVSGRTAAATASGRRIGFDGRFDKLIVKFACDCLYICLIVFRVRKSAAGEVPLSDAGGIEVVRADEFSQSRDGSEREIPGRQSAEFGENKLVAAHKHICRDHTGTGDVQGFQRRQILQGGQVGDALVAAEVQIGDAGEEIQLRQVVIADALIGQIECPDAVVIGGQGVIAGIKGCFSSSVSSPSMFLTSVRKSRTAS